MTGMTVRTPMRAPGRQGSVRRPLHTETTTSQALYLPIAPPTLGTAGTIIGRELHSGKAFIYPFSAFGDGLPGGNVIVMGDTGRARAL